MVRYPINPINAVGIPNVLETAPEIIALQLIKLLTLQGWKGGRKNLSQRKYNARKIPKIAKI